LVFTGVSRYPVRFPCYTFVDIKTPSYPECTKYGGIGTEISTRCLEAFAFSQLLKHVFQQLKTSISTGGAT